jgi:hypothetical protein
MEGQARCNETTSNADGIHVMCGREAFALIPDRDGDGRPVALQVCWMHLIPTLRRQQEARNK